MHYTFNPMIPALLYLQKASAQNEVLSELSKEHTRLKKELGET
jgi:hypothetical protein